jgi:hypothetical protein
MEKNTVQKMKGKKTEITNIQPQGWGNHKELIQARKGILRESLNLKVSSS